MTRLHHFEQMTVATELLPNGGYNAIDHDNFDLGFPQGRGHSRFAAILDLTEQMRDRGMLPEAED
jgi:hypothetical protein